MRQVQPGDVIGSCECPGCGAQTPLKINRNGSVYFFCAKRVGVNPETGKQEACYTRMSFGRTGSKKMIEQFLQAEEEINDVQDATGEAEEPNDGAEIADVSGWDAGEYDHRVLDQPVTPRNSAAGFVDGLKRFLTD